MKHCLGCKHPGKDCIPYLMTLSADDIGEWCRARKQAMGTTYEEIAEKTGVPIGTVKRIMAEKATDCRFSTMQPIICFLSGCTDEALDCENARQNDIALVEKTKAQGDTIRRMEEENRRQYSYIENLQRRSADELDRAKKEEAESIAYLKKQMKVRLVTIYVLAAALAIALLLIIAALVIDKSNQNVGFFWLKSFLFDGVEQKDDAISKLIQTTGWRG